MWKLGLFIHTLGVPRPWVLGLGTECALPFPPSGGSRAAGVPSSHSTEYREALGPLRAPPPAHAVREF
jgi:hypothetical protein